jgi:hypothetical protein
MSQCIQAIASVLMVLLTGATLYVLCGYARDTKRIANDSATQVERAQMPFLAVVMKERDADSAGGWVLENQGFGPAINITFFDDGNGERRVCRVRPIGTGGQSNVLPTIANALQQPQGFEVGYESLSGKDYRTTVARRDGRDETTFHRL